MEGAATLTMEKSSTTMQSAQQSNVRISRCKGLKGTLDGEGEEGEGIGFLFSLAWKHQPRVLRCASSLSRFSRLPGMTTALTFSNSAAVSKSMLQVTLVLLPRSAKLMVAWNRGPLT